MAHVSGAYKFCFDNSHTEYFSKSVYFDLIYENNTSEEDRFNVSVEHNSEFENQLTGLKVGIILMNHSYTKKILIFKKYQEIN